MLTQSCNQSNRKGGDRKIHGAYKPGILAGLASFRSVRGTVLIKKVGTFCGLTSEVYFWLENLWAHICT